jgi:hypothetical protein
MVELEVVVVVVVHRTMDLIQEPAVMVVVDVL